MHTPGPWECSIYQDKISWHYRLFANETDLSAKANALLISSAPDLLEALKSFLRAPSIGSDGPGSHTIVVQDFNIKAAKAAIAKATGKDGLE
jgi:hypothetical protein